MGNSRKPSAPIKGQVREMKPLTPEERQEQEQALRMYAQKRESIATGCLFNLCRNPHTTDETNLEALVEAAIIMADKMIEKLYFPPYHKEEVK
jgi:hypothetical protein